VRSQGKYSSQQIDAIKGIEAVQSCRGGVVFRDKMRNPVSFPSRKSFFFRSNFVVMSYDSVRKTIGLLSPAFFLLVCCANQVPMVTQIAALSPLASLNRERLRRDPCAPLAFGTIFSSCRVNARLNDISSSRNRHRTRRAH